MNITFIPGLTFDEQIAAWMNGTEDEHRMARWVSENAVVSARDLDEAFEIGRADGVQVGYDDGYSKGFDEGFDEGFDHGREQGRLDAEEKQQDD